MDRFTLISDDLMRIGVSAGPLVKVRSVGGGCINDCFQVRTGDRDLFLKMNSADAYPGMFSSEAAGLALLAQNGSLRVPAVVAEGRSSNHAYLLMEYLESGRRAPDFWYACGRGLARLHRNVESEFGLEEDNYIGSMVQYNGRMPSWPGFFLERRLIPQLEAGLSAGWADRIQFRQAERFARTIEAEFPTEPPSLLHGDLWGGNLMVDIDGRPVLVDPAVYYGNREVELSFTMMFGGFAPEFYEAYDAEWALQPGLRQRAAMHNLYPLLVHANLFGGHYVQQVRDLLGRVT